MPDGGGFLKFYYRLNIAFHQGDPDFVDSEARTKFPKTIPTSSKGSRNIFREGNLKSRGPSYY